MFSSVMLFCDDGLTGKTSHSREFLFQLDRFIYCCFSYHNDVPGVVSSAERTHSCIHLAQKSSHNLTFFFSTVQLIQGCYGQEKISGK